MSGLALNILSFSFRKGIPADANFVFDARFLNNPHYDPTLQAACGLDAPVGAAIEQDTEFAFFFGSLIDTVRRLSPRFEEKKKDRLVVAIGCTGGRHRSVYTAKKLHDVLKDLGYNVQVTHRDLHGD